MLFIKVPILWSVAMYSGYSAARPDFAQSFTLAANSRILEKLSPDCIGAAFRE